MKKAIFLVLALAIIWAIPGVRQRIGLAMLPVLEKLGPVGDFAASPVRAFKARNELAFFLRIMQDDDAEGRALPNERTFADWIDRRMPQETGIDPWGQAYWLERRGSTFTVGSSGADAERGTDDDVTQQSTI